jgi:lipopolysaccharide transport system ATP-binding protein
MTHSAIAVRNLAKSYTIRHNAPDHVTLAEAALARLRNPLRRAQKETFWALNDITFDVQEGDVVGVIGRNGAGKSTLLKILSRITPPTRGSIELFGRVGSLLEVGTGFHPELTGRENIFLNGAILGMRKPEIRKHFDAIVDFAGVEQFLDTPVKRYSSGMYVRLAFAVAAHLESEILIVDEVLAVGDTEFQNKCLGKMKDVSQSGRTVLFVSHQMQSVNVLCNKAMFLEKGVCTYAGTVPEAIDRYVKSFKKPTNAIEDASRRPGSGEYRFTSVTPAKEFFTCGEEKVIRFELRRNRPMATRAYLSCHINNSSGATVAQCDSRLVGFWMEPCERFRGELAVRTPWLKPGEYRVEMFICTIGNITDRVEDACTLGVSDTFPYAEAISADGFAYGVVLPDFSWSA